MKNIINISLLGALLIFASSCEDDFLDRFPETEIGKENFFNTEEDLSIYVNNLYNFPAPTTMYTNDGYQTTDNSSNTGNTTMKTIMTTDASSATLNNGWDWERLRTINFFLENFGKAAIPQEALNHYEGVARFFRAQFYMDKVKQFSNVPWYDQTLTTADEEELFKTQDSRDFVIDKIFEDYEFAAANVRESQPAGAVNRAVVKTYMARHALYEGSFRKYHEELGLQSTANRFLEIARDMAKDIMDSGAYSIYNTGNPEQDYYDLFVSADLAGNSEVILVNIAIDGLKNSGSSEIVFGNFETSPSKDLLQAYLMADGTYYTDLADYQTKEFVEEFNNRDNRLYQTYAFPGWELLRTGTYAQGGGIYIQQLQKNFTGYHQIKGFVNDPNQVAINNVDAPVLRYAEVLLTFAEAQAELGALSQGDLDISINLLRERAGMPLMTMNPSVDAVQEARYPKVSGATTQWKELLEIRRERRIELALEGHRLDDILRWSAGKLLEVEPEGPYFPGLGMYDLTGDGIEDIALIDVSESIPAAEDKAVNSLGTTLIYYRVGLQDSDANVYLANGNGGAIQSEKERGTFVDPKHYYRPIPQTHITVNPNLTQVFGWN